MKKNIIREKSYEFALHTVILTRKLREWKAESPLINQVLRSGTSIAANVEEADAAISKAEFSSKISIAFKEAREIHFWLRLLIDVNFNKPEVVKLKDECEEILRILWAILRRTRMTAR